MKRYLAMVFLVGSLSMLCMSFDGKGNMNRYNQISTAEEGQWAVPQKNEHIKELNWLIGDWKQEDGDLIFRTKAEKVLNENFVVMDFGMYLKDKMQLEGKQMIAWNPLEKHFFSWVFDSDGGYGQGKWKKKGNSWIIENVYTFSNGSRGRSINIYTVNSENNITWELTGREIDGKILPNLGPIKITRKKG